MHRLDLNFAATVAIMISIAVIVPILEAANVVGFIRLPSTGGYLPETTRATCEGNTNTLADTGNTSSWLTFYMAREGGSFRSSMADLFKQEHLPLFFCAPVMP